MKHRFTALLTAALLSVLPSATLQAAEVTQSVAGYWSGAVSLPNVELAIAVELAAGGPAWQGTIDIPMQGLRAFKLDPVKVEGGAVEFGLPGIPGEPKFSGKLAEDGKSITGNLSQGGGSMPFHLARAVKPAPRPEDTIPEHGVPGQGLVGKWRGVLNPLPNIELRLGLELAPDSAGAPGGVLVSIDQGNSRIPITGLKDEAGKVHFETPTVQGEYNGQMSADGSEMAGEWKQRGSTTALVFKRLAP